MVKKKKVIQTKGKKKRSTARLRLKEGKTSIKINGAPISLFKPLIFRKIMEEPIIIAKEVLGEKFLEGSDIDINVKGGGVSGQAYACRTALGKALLQLSKSDVLKKAYVDYDRSLIIDDVRVKESKKYLRKGARARPTKSYR
jgi:small subunit ribosomal protein S9